MSEPNYKTKDYLAICIVLLVCGIIACLVLYGVFLLVAGMFASQANFKIGLIFLVACLVIFLIFWAFDRVSVLSRK